MRHYRVLFVCIGNSCRSQMAEAFARAYGRDVMVVRSAGWEPSGMVSPLTRELMLEKNIKIEGSITKGFDTTGTDYDLIVNMSGRPLPANIAAPVREWKVEDPIGLSTERHREIRDQVEGLVQGLVIELRRRRDGGRG